VPTKSHSSFAYLINKAFKLGLDLCGLRFVYLSEKTKEEFVGAFHSGELEVGRAYLAVLFKGVEVDSKIEKVLGHFNPEMARRSGEKGVRACFGRSKLENCVV